MRKILTSFSLVAASLAFAQVGINADESDIANDAVFHVKNKSGEAKGVILPSVSLDSTTDQTAITGGVVTTGLMVWNDGNGTLKEVGYYYWDGEKWVLTGNKDGGSSANIYSENGTLLGERTVTHDNYDLTFTTGTGAVVVDGKSKLMGASYVKVTKVTGTSYTVAADDYYIAVDGPTDEVILTIPEASDSKGRVLIISNTTSGNVALKDPSGQQLLYGTDSPSIAPNHAEWIISDGAKWFNLINF